MEQGQDPLAYINKRCLGLNNRIDQEIQVRKNQLKEVRDSLSEKLNALNKEDDLGSRLDKEILARKSHFKEVAKVRDSLSAKLKDLNKKFDEKNPTDLTGLGNKMDHEIEVRKNQFCEFTKNRKTVEERIRKIESVHKKDVSDLRNQLKSEKEQRKYIELRLKQLELLLAQKMSQEISTSTMSYKSTYTNGIKSDINTKKICVSQSLQDLTTSKVFQSSMSLEEYIDKMSSVGNSSASAYAELSEVVLSDGDDASTISSLLEATDSLSIVDGLTMKKEKKRSRGKRKAKKKKNKSANETKSDVAAGIQNAVQTKEGGSEKVPNVATGKKYSTMRIQNVLTSSTNYGGSCSYLERAHEYLSNLQQQTNGESLESVAMLLNGLENPPADVTDRILRTTMEWVIRKRNTTVTEIIYHSGTFYTSKPGYRVQLRAQIDRLHGDVYFSVRILKGLFDENLTWPFPLKFCIKLSPKMKIIEPDDWIIPSAPFWMKEMHKPLTKNDDIFSEWCGPFNISSFLDTKKLIFEFSMLTTA